MSVKVNALDHLVINVSDLARSTEWYRKILGMEVRVFDPGNGGTPRSSLMFGTQKINVRPADAESWVSGRTAKPGAADLCFVTAVGPQDVVGHLHSCGVLPGLHAFMYRFARRGVRS